MAGKNNKIKSKYLLQGVPASPGIAISKVFKLKGESIRVDPTILDDSSVDTEIEKFVTAVEKSKSELKSLQNKVVHKVGQENAKIFDVHQLLLKDSVVIEETIHSIKKENTSAEFAFYQIMQKYENTLTGTSINHFQSRSSDLRDVKRRVIRHIQGDRTDHLKQLSGSAVIVTNDLFGLLEYVELPFF